MRTSGGRWKTGFRERANGSAVRRRGTAGFSAHFHQGGSRPGRGLGYKRAMGARNWLGRGRDWGRDIAAALIVGAFVGVIGPFGTFLFGPVWLRVAYWAGMFAIGVLVYGTGLRRVIRMRPRAGWPGWLLVSLMAALLAAPMSVLCALVDTTLWPRAAYYMSPADWYLQVTFVSVPLNLLLFWLHRALQTPPEPPVPTVPVDSRRVLTGDLRDRLPARLGDRIVCLQMEDHYVRVHTDRGSELVLTPLKEALAALSGVEGLQTHRSWWVARDAVQEVVRSGRNVRLRLVNGLETPVARSAVARLRDAGCLAPSASAPVHARERGA